MALLDDGMQCVICGKIIPCVDTEKLFCTTFHGIRDPRFKHLDDAAMHQSCLDEWGLRDAFVSYYNEKCENELQVVNGSVVYRQNPKCPVFRRILNRLTFNRADR